MGPCEDRTRLINDNADELPKWLYIDGRTEPQLAYWVPKYIKYRGTVKCVDLGDMSPGIFVLARSQDLIGWTYFMEGRISKFFKLLSCRCRELHKWP